MTYTYLQVQALQEAVREAAHSQVSDQSSLALREEGLTALQAELDACQSAYVASLAAVNEDLRRER
jgi:hypothetical protein